MRLENVGLLILRVGIGGFMLFGHGWSKLLNFGQMATSFPDPIGVGSQISLALTVFAEVFCAFFIMIGLFTRYTVVPLVITMLVAAFIVHGGDPWGKKEFCLLYAIPLISLFFTGPGDFSVDKFRSKA
jgi:putative oxidoreductase